MRFGIAMSPLKVSATSDGEPELPYLNKSGADAQIQADTQDADHCGDTQTKLLIAELILIKVSIISPCSDVIIRIGQKKRERDCIEIHHVLCPMFFRSRRA